jgi:RNA polymerase sigma-70 factor, ECF subfamily
MRRVVAGDRSAFASVVAIHRDAAWRYVRGRAHDPARAEEALQETFLAVWRGASGYRGDASLRSWILGVARRQLARSERLRAGEPRDHEALTSLGAAAGWGAPSPEDAAVSAEDVARVQAAIAQLSPEDAEILVLRDLERLTADEACAVLDLSLAAQKSRLHRARLRLMAALRAGGHDG